MNERSIFQQALDIPELDARQRFLDEACQGDADLRQRLSGLLQAHQLVSSFLEHPPIDATSPFTPSPSIPAPTTVLVSGGTFASRFKLRERLGEGGMGTVYVADQLEPVQRRVALKVIKAGRDSRQLLARFEQERQALALMDHPNIAKVYDAGVADGMPYFVMELIKGVPITKYCDDAKLTPRQRLELFIPVCQGVQHAHQKGIIHRDLKPSNILVGLYDGKPIPKVIDFGVAKATGPQLTDESIYTEVGSLIGTLEYMSPEQAELNNLDIDTRTDVYALGVILYELLTGGVPFSRKELEKAGLAEMLRVIKEVEPPKPSTKLSGSGTLPSIAAVRQTEPQKLRRLVRGELDWIVMKALEKDRTRRYETANGFAVDVLRYLANEPVLAGPPSLLYKTRKFVRRNKSPVAAMVAVAALLVLGSVGTAIGFVRAEQRRGEAENARADEATQRRKAERAEAETLADYRASTDDAIEQLIGSKPELGPQERAYLEKTLKRWQTFANRQGNDERSRAIRGEGHARVGFLWQKLDRMDEALIEFSLARDIFMKLVDQFPEERQYRQELAISHSNVGAQFAGLGKRHEARDEWCAARELQKRLVQQFPAEPTYQHGLAVNHFNMGLLLAGFGEHQEARGEYQLARDLLKRLIEQLPVAPPEYRQKLATTHLTLGLLLAELGQRQEARLEYQAARDLQEKLIEQFPKVPEYQRDLALTHHNLGTLLQGIGQREEAQLEHQTARALRRTLVEQFPAIPAYQLHLANTHNSLGFLLAGLLKPEEARTELLAARDIQQKLVHQFSGVPAYQQDLAKTYNNLGFLLSGMGKPDEAMAAYTAANDIQKKLVVRFPAMPEYEEDLARTHNNMGIVLAGCAKREEARAEYQAACDILKKLSDRFPAVPAYQIGLGDTYCNYGVLIGAEDKPAESVWWFDLAIQTLQPLHEKEPRDVKAKLYLHNAYWNRALAYDELKKPATAAKDWERAIELSPPVEQPSRRARRVSWRLRIGLVEEAVADATELTAPNTAIARNWSSEQWYDFARVYAIASIKIADKQQEYADRAMELLQRATKAGYNTAAHMAKDTDLDGLRGREDFKRLLTEMESGKSPEKK